jgi:hypothetical protein
MRARVAKFSPTSGSFAPDPLPRSAGPARLLAPFPAGLLVRRGTAARDGTMYSLGTVLIRGLLFASLRYGDALV